MKELEQKQVDMVYEPLLEAPVERLPHLLLKFLQVARKATGQVYASGTIITLFTGVCSILSSRERDPVNVKLDPRFEKLHEMLRVKTNLSAAEGRGSGCTAKRPVTKEHLRAALEAGTVGREAPKPLLTSVYLASVMGFGARTGAECHMIENGDLVIGPLDEAYGVPQWIELSERITKTRSGNAGDERELIPRIFPNHEFPETCYVRTVMEYQSRKTEHQLRAEGPFFLTINQAAARNPEKFQYWYYSGIMGVNMLKTLLTDALEGAGIDCKVEKYSAISLRKSMLQTGVDVGVPDMHLSRLAGHKSLVSKKAYIKSGGDAQKAGVLAIHKQMYHSVNRGYEHEVRHLDLEVGTEDSSNQPENRRRSEEGPSEVQDSRIGPLGSRSIVKCRDRSKERSYDKSRDRDPSYNRSRDPSCNRSRDRDSCDRSRDRSYNMSRDRSYNRRSDRSYSRSRDRSRNRSRDRSYNRSRDKSYNRSRERSYNMNMDRSRDRRCESMMDRSYDMSRDRSHGRNMDKGYVRSRDRSYNMSKDRSRDRRRDRSSDRSRDRSRDGSRDRSRDRSRNRSRNGSYDRSRYRSYNMSRDRSYDTSVNRSYNRNRDRDNNKSYDRNRNSGRDGSTDRRTDSLSETTAALCTTRTASRRLSDPVPRQPLGDFQTRRSLPEPLRDMREEQSFRELEQTQSILTQTVMKRHTLSGSPAEMKRLEMQILELQEKLERLVSSQAAMAQKRQCEAQQPAAEADKLTGSEEAWSTTADQDCKVG
jgi:U4/U6.U5 tri-snRNP-associated protein 3